ncbi:hypothetical protein [Nocardia xishanensis]|uniref:YbaB/EbfC DNA-binding family protein n=1 Tax=Nocardia xishanensis TaxID=238964 RepID=A0ABW7X6J4_9NOCA
MSDIDPLTGQINELQASLQSARHRPENQVARIEVGEDGALRAIHLTDMGRRLDPDTLCAEIVRLHTEALAESRKAISAAIAQIENDPRLQALIERSTDALNQRLPDPAPPSASSPISVTQPLLPDSATRQSVPATPASSAPRPPSHVPPGPGKPAPQVAPAPPSNLPPLPPSTRGAVQPSLPSKSREPTQEEEEEMDRYYQRKSWLEY